MDKNENLLNVIAERVSVLEKSLEITTHDKITIPCGVSVGMLFQDGRNWDVVMDDFTITLLPVDNTKEKE